MKSRTKVIIAIAGAVGVCMAYFIAVTLYSFQTLTIENQSDRPITIEVYDLSWTIAPHARTVKRFQAIRGDTHFTVLDTETKDEIGSLGYLTHGMSDCHKVSIGDAAALSYTINTKAICHLQNW